MKANRFYRFFIALLVGIFVLSIGAVPICAAAMEGLDYPSSFADLYDMDLAPYGSVLTRDLSSGMEGPDVAFLQSMLFRMDYFNGEVNGVFGADTEEAVTAFQGEYKSLVPNGLVEYQTKDKLNRELYKVPDSIGFLIFDAILSTGSSYTVKPIFEDNESHTVTLTCNSPVISISGMNITALSPGSAEVRAECEGKLFKFFISVRDEAEIASRVGDIQYANFLPDGVKKRVQDLAAYPGEMDSLVLFAGDCYLDERLFLTDFESRFADSNVFSISLSGSSAGQWRTYIQEFYSHQPAAMVLCVGTNDLRHGKSAVATIRNLEALIEEIRQNMPDTTIYWWNILPHLEAEEEYYKIAAVNAAILEYSRQDDKLIVIDSYEAMTDENGIPIPELYRDNLHPNSEGYDRIFQKTYDAGLTFAQQ